MQRLVEDAGETCLVARSGDEGMVERVWSLVEDAGETCLVARSGDEGMVERVWSILVSIVVSIPACHAGDPGTIPGREASFCSHLLFCSSALLLPPALLLFCSSALLPPPTLLLFCSSALLFFAAFFPAVRAPQPTSLMLPTHSWRIGTSAAVESDSPTRTKIDTCTAPYSSILVSIVVSIPACHAGDPGTIPGREASFCSHLLFCSSALLLPPALLLFCSSALLPPPTLLLFCSSALLFFAAFFPAVRAPQPTSLMLPTHSWRIGTSAAVESDSPTRTKIDTCTAPYSSLVEDAGETCLVARSGDEGMVERVWSLVEDAGETCLVARSGDEGMVERVWSLVEDAGETCLVARSGDEGMVERVWSCV
ncbi:hypothetical protein P3T76_016353 [Phytophthora citrophthora]|uniref:Uncharacterized protein n=1 Tax=Phytophthora citrophthora TaxID=4793 RepID=A0AAD9FXP7_9STRA|nr:hypothetical protein P3T76_016353 [Phytophthora citrophthora]